LVPTADELLTEARAHYGSSRWPEAMARYQALLAIQPECVEALHAVGAILAAQGRLDDAALHLEQALRLATDSGAIAESLRRIYAARESQRATALLQHGDAEGAVGGYRRALALVPDDADTHYNVGCALVAQRHLDDALAAYRRALALDAGHFDACLQVANTLLKQKKLREAEEYFRRAVSLRLDHPDALNNLGGVLHQQGQLEEAETCYRRVVSIDPASAEARNNLGVVLMNRGRLHEALACYAEALRLNPDYVPALTNRALALLSLDATDEPLALYQRALQLDSDNRAARFNLGFLRTQENRLEEALAHYEHVLRTNPADPEAHFHRALTLLGLGRLAEGWEEHEWRWKRPGCEEPARDAPRWTGGRLDGRSILLWTEQGYGDSLQFVRYAPLVKQQGATVVVECEAALAGILGSCPGVDCVVARGDRLPAYDCHVPLVSLPHVFRTCIDTVPAAVPYLAPRPAALARWNAELSRDPSPRIGIAWRGNQENPTDRRRAIPLAQFARIAQRDDVRLYSLQVGAGREQLDHFAGRSRICDLADRLADFEDTAAVMCQLDLVICCDSAPAHLAGALGVPVWVALPFAADWRWMLKREESPWYPSMRLFRQPRPGNWDAVLARIEHELATRWPTVGRDRRT
jgi:tetratricopeptide (TPR) repeat protein